MRIRNERRRTRDEGRERMAGFTLIETIITLVVLSIAAVGVLSVFTMGTRGSANPLLVEQAVQLAQEKMDDIIGDRENPALGFAQIIPGNYPAETAAQLGFPGFSRNTTIYCVSPPPPANALNTPTVGPPCVSGYTHVTVTVANALIGSVSVETIVTNY